MGKIPNYKIYKPGEHIFLYQKIKETALDGSLIKMRVINDTDIINSAQVSIRKDNENSIIELLPMTEMYKINQTEYYFDFVIPLDAKDDKYCVLFKNKINSSNQPNYGGYTILISNDIKSPVQGTAYVSKTTATKPIRAIKPISDKAIIHHSLGIQDDVFYKDGADYNFLKKALSEIKQPKKEKLTKSATSLKKKELRINKQINLILKSGIDFSQQNWLSELAIKLDKCERHLKKWIETFMPEFYKMTA